MPIDWTPLAEVLDRHSRFLVTTHVRPDGDALGSAQGMAELIEARGKTARLVMPSAVPPRYAFLDPDRRFARFGDPGATADELRDFDALLILDLSSWSQLGEMAPWVRDFSGTRLIIDHHQSADDLGAIVLKDPTAEATGALVLEAAEALGVPISPSMATALLTALAMDTGWFRHASVTPATFRAAARLLEAGADAHTLYRQLYEQNTPGRLRLIGTALSRLRLDADGRIAYTTVERADFEQSGAIPPETEDLVDYTVSIAGVEVGLLFIEQLKGGIKLSLRARSDFDCARLAARFGGGGHRAAAGAPLPDPLQASLPAVLDAVRSQLAQNPGTPA
ncbi:MAG: phosphodiesterase [Isosphaeraceae bacterium]|jgi:phosphoesterase RecJ-like protein|nr:MAG: phosphodiesterase [Isosphaeraceae bacterium]